MNNKSFVCPKCGYKNEKAVLRCPRCFQWLAISCDGRCSRCKQEKNKEKCS
ncbi:hypothetical protein [Candidatus Contubernalis alkaliaceticus]|uniref:hypothetical protein n=1 Tax=Candidatus Contubernalis alkaliaceticus TaxID=338645 RepID=UPI001F4BD91C|nr:hypothetical protein [Candidatus Contubernalis alkalaceticus]UNC93250.1 hypothetical protein HUE98_14840 [Candidatus Contubernalis alkalaceticus]